MEGHRLTIVRPAVRTFAKAMEAKLKLNDHKGGWTPENCTEEYLDERLIQEVREYTQSADPGELVDIANFCMMLYSRRLETGEYK